MTQTLSYIIVINFGKYLNIKDEYLTYTDKTEAKNRFEREIIKNVTDNHSMLLHQAAESWDMTLKDFNNVINGAVEYGIWYGTNMSKIEFIESKLVESAVDIL